MKTKLFSIITVLFLLPQFNVKAQQITPDMFTEPNNTGSNMTLGFLNTDINSEPNAIIVAFYDIDGDGSLESVGYRDEISAPFDAFALWGDDPSTPEKDGLSAGEVPIFAALIDGSVILLNPTPQFTGYVNNGIPTPFIQINPTDLSGNSVKGCTDVTSCNYSSQMVFDDGSCSYPLEYYDCSGNCLKDADSDGVCDENEISGCKDEDYVEYNPSVTENDDGSCITTWEEGYNNLEIEISNQSSQISDLQIEKSTIESELSDVSYQLDTMTNAYQILLESPQCEEIIIDIKEGWNMFGYTSSKVLDIGAVMSEFDDYIFMIKDNNGRQYWPENDYNGIGDFIPGNGYQIKAYQPFSISFEN